VGRDLGSVAAFTSSSECRSVISRSRGWKVNVRNVGGTFHGPDTAHTAARKGVAMARVEWKDFKRADETRTFHNGRVEVLKLESGTVGRMILEPGWRWSVDVKPIVGTEWCEAPHFQYVVSGTIHVVMQDGREFDLGPGSVSHLPAGHDAWVVGKEPVVAVDWYGASNYAKR
jgi:mannose-6-phosphate isomerase-like protein (cupin superfamily)